MHEENKDGSFPRLAYVGHAPVEPTYYGSAVLYRLLEDYPREKLIVVESNLLTSLPQRRLPKVIYRILKTGRKRLLATRFGAIYAAWLSSRAPCRAAELRRVLADLRPQAILTVAHGYAWITAAAYAKQGNLPLHLIIHDDWPRVANVPGWFRPSLDRRFRAVYRQAASRLCVSPPMEATYRRRYGVPGLVFYPLRQANAAKFTDPPPRLGRDNGPLTVAFAGTINSGGYMRALARLARSLEPSGGRLLIFGPLVPLDTAVDDLRKGNVEWRGMLPSDQLASQLRAEVDVLFAPMSFDAGDAENMKMGFPSKIADYTATGLALLICGPEYCSAVQWAKTYSPVAEVVTSEDPGALTNALNSLSSAPHRSKLAEHALKIGEQLFSHATVFGRFRRCLVNEQLV